MLDSTAIRSTANPLVKRVRTALRRGSAEAVVLEGDRLVDDALASGLDAEVVLVREERADRAAELAARGLLVRLISSELLESLSRLTSSPGILALFRAPTRRDWSELPSSAAALVVVAAGIQDPGNLGALARTAEAAGADALVVTSGGCRPWSEKALRGSMGSLLRMAVHEAGSASEAWQELSSAGFRPVVARTRGGRAPREVDWSGRVSLWLTSEKGEPLGIDDASAEGVTIPMAHGAESLNVTVAAAVLLFAAGRTEPRS